MAMRLSSNAFLARFDALMEQGISDAIIVTHGGRDRFVMLAASDYARLMAQGDDGPDAALPEVDLDTVEWNR